MLLFFLRRTFCKYSSKFPCSWAAVNKTQIILCYCRKKGGVLTTQTSILPYHTIVPTLLFHFQLTIPPHAANQVQHSYQLVATQSELKIEKNKLT